MPGKQIGCPIRISVLRYLCLACLVKLAACEKGETQSRWSAFFKVFQGARRSVAWADEHGEQLDNHIGNIDLLWLGRRARASRPVRVAAR